MNAVYEHAVSTVKKQRPELLDKMTKSVGFAMGIEFREGSLLLSVKNNLRIRKGNYVVILITYTSHSINLQKGEGLSIKKIVRVMVFNATFNNISVILWRSVLLVDKTGVPGETTNLPQVTDKLYNINVSCTARHQQDSNSQF